MTRDKQLHEVDLNQTVEKRRLGQALNAKEFAGLAGISYSMARAWFLRPGFPIICGVVFWQDFVQWRQLQAGLGAPMTQATRSAIAAAEPAVEIRRGLPFTCSANSGRCRSTGPYGWPPQYHGMTTTGVNGQFDPSREAYRFEVGCTATALLRKSWRIGRASGENRRLIPGTEIGQGA
jgi:hypothetical protein